VKLYRGKEKVMSPRWLLLSMVSLCCAGATAEVFKCVDESGGISYQFTSCDAPGERGTVGGMYNVLPLGIPPRDADVIEEIGAERARAKKERVEHRNRHIDRLILRMRKRETTCRLLKARYNEMSRRKRRQGRGDPEAEADLIKNMRVACSG
jgi:hypothetical protein